MAPALSTAEGSMNTIELTRHAEHWELSLQAPKVNVFNEALLTDLGHALRSSRGGSGSAADSFGPP